MRIVKSKDFWIGVVAGVFVVPLVLGKMPNVKSKIPGNK